MSSRRVLLPWMIAPGVVVGVIGLMMLRVPMRVRFELSRPAMDRLARQALDDPNSVPTSGMVGLYYVDKIETVPGGVWLRPLRADFVERCGFAYCEDGEPAPRIGVRTVFESIGSDWYTWCEGS